MDRGREVGLRKVMGSHRSSLVYQFLTESMVINLLALLLSFGLVVLVTPYFSSGWRYPERICHLGTSLVLDREWRNSYYWIFFIRTISSLCTVFIPTSVRFAWQTPHIWQRSHATKSAGNLPVFYVGSHDYRHCHGF